MTAAFKVDSSLDTYIIQYPSGKWHLMHSARSTHGYSEAADPKVKAIRVVQVISICLDANVMAPCHTILSEVLKDTEAEGLPERFRDLYIPFVMELRVHLTSRGLRLSSPPFGEAIRRIVQLHVDTFKPRTQPTFKGPPLIPQFRCSAYSCPTCSNLYAFMISSATNECMFHTARDRMHVEGQLRDLKNVLFSFETITSRSKQTLVVKKLPTAIGLTHRQEAVGNRKAFLDIVGRDEVTLMFGDAYYRDVTT
jgi:hypothetical protein